MNREPTKWSKTDIGTEEPCVVKSKKGKTQGNRINTRQQTHYGFKKTSTPELFIRSESPTTRLLP